ncbi:MAG: hypothetical protein EPO24_06605, partial [Bacteroidetes bacterium]
MKIFRSHSIVNFLSRRRSRVYHGSSSFHIRHLAVFFFFYFVLCQSCLSLAVSQTEDGSRKDASFDSYRKGGSVSKSSTRNGGENASTNSVECGSNLLSMRWGDSTLSTKTLELKEEVKIIVQFKNPPISTVANMRLGLKGVGQLTALTAIQAEHSQFKSDLANLEGVYRSRQVAQAALVETRIHFEYTMAINGVALTTSRWIGEEIQKLPYVERVEVDNLVQKCDDTSNAIIGAPEFWSTYDKHGENMDIGIIDTGIDYFHEALGGASFPNGKVVGGYDIFNEDNDPMDDNGHGTHVAGIAAGLGPPPTNLRGVAYKARLWAFKVLGSGGWGYFSQVVGGIEKALDPDDNPSTPTPIDVINLSLGGPPLPSSDDVMSQAVNNAMHGGIVCAVAAGNSGPYYMSVGSPGCAKGALTVGALYGSDSVVTFSSRGPTYNGFSLKPDIVAPGVRILSAQMGGGYVRYSGTSMATPHVAGAAAILRQLHPDWTPDDVKAAFKQTARKLGRDVWTEGNGKIFIPDAAIEGVLIQPTNLNLGVVEVSERYWIVNRTITIHNRTPYTEQMSCFYDKSLLPGVALTISPMVFQIAAGDTMSVNITFKVDNSIVGYTVFNGATTSPSLFGTIRIKSKTSPTEADIHFSLTKTTMLRIIADETPWWLGI